MKKGWELEHEQIKRTVPDIPDRSVALTADAYQAYIMSIKIGGDLCLKPRLMCRWTKI